MRKPIVIVNGAGGVDLVPGWGPALVSITITDNDGGEADELSIVFAVQPPFPGGPVNGTMFAPVYGWAGEALRPAGIFTAQNTAYGGDAESGYTMTVTARAADFVDKMKEMSSEHFDDKTAGDIFQKIAGDAGISATVDPEIAATKLPYKLRWRQSPVGFATELASDLGGTLKLSNGQMLVAKRNAGTTASGTPMPPIVIDFRQTTEINIEIEGRPEYAATSTDWFDPLEGVTKPVDGTSVGSGGKYLPLHPFASEDEAKKGGDARAQEEARSGISGDVTCEGLVGAMAGAPVILVGFGAGLEALEIVAPKVTQTFTFDEDGGFTTTVDLENKKTSTSSSSSA